MKIKCYAKINLFLNILKKRNDGFHEIDSLFQNVTLSDELHLRLTKTSQFSLIVQPSNRSLSGASNHSSDKDFLENNLIEKVYKDFSKSYGIGGVEARLEKCIPMGAGLGGGSANAAGMMLGLNKLFGLKLSEEKLLKKSPYYGADVSFFLRGGTAFVSGVGNEIKSCDKKIKLFLVLVYPNVHVATKESYRKYAKLSSNFSESIESNTSKKMADLLFRASDFSENNLEKNSPKNLLAQAGKLAYNGFQEKLLNNFEDIKIVYEALRKESDFVLISGSGSSVFGLFENKESAKKSFDNLSKIYPQNTHLLKTCENALEVDA